MTTLKMLNKLGNAVRARNGRRWSSGGYVHAPQRTAQDRVDRWLFRLRQRGIRVSV